MAIFHLSVNLISRKAGRSSTAAAAYRAAERIEDERTGEVHDYSRRSGVESAELVLPSGVEWQPERAEFWNAVEAKNKRADAQVAREFVVALPAELDAGARRDLAVQFARVIVDRYQVGADVAIHAPGRGDDRNHHAHLLTTTNRVEVSGKLGNKVRELDGIAASRGEGPNAVEQLRSIWADLTNQALEKAGSPARIDHRTLADQGIDRAPTVHLGPAAFGYERRTGEVSRKRADFEIGAEAFERLRQAKAAGEQERREINRTILDLSTDLAAAKAEQAKEQEQAAQAAAQEQAEKARIERMSANELLPEIGQLRPLPVKDLIERDPVVIQLSRELRELTQKQSEARKSGLQADHEAKLWRMESPFKASLHDKGLWRSKELDQFEQVKAESVRVIEELRPRVLDLERAEEKARRELEERLTREQAPVLARVSELMAIWKGKEQQERAERAKHHARDDAEKKFKKWASLRSLRSSGWGDRGEDWQRLPPALREAIETYNAAPAGDKAAFLDRLLSPQQVAEVDKLQKDMDRGRGR